MRYEIANGKSFGTANILVIFQNLDITDSFVINEKPVKKFLCATYRVWENSS